MKSIVFIDKKGYAKLLLDYDFVSRLRNRMKELDLKEVFIALESKKEWVKE